MKQIQAECMYCGQMVAMEVDDNVTEAECGELAALQCECEASEQWRAMQESKEKAIENADELFREFPDVLDIMKECVKMIAKGKMESVTINTGRNVKAKIMRTPNGKMKVERYDSTKKVFES